MSACGGVPAAGQATRDGGGWCAARRGAGVVRAGFTAFSRPACSAVKEAARAPRVMTSVMTRVGRGAAGAARGLSVDCAASWLVRWGARRARGAPARAAVLLGGGGGRAADSSACYCNYRNFLCGGETRETLHKILAGCGGSVSLLVRPMTMFTLLYLDAREWERYTRVRRP